MLDGFCFAGRIAVQTIGFSAPQKMRRCVFPEKLIVYRENDNLEIDKTSNTANHSVSQPNIVQQLNFSGVPLRIAKMK